MKILLVGSPNVGKTTLFNVLTGSKARVGNFAGTTVDFRSATTKISGKELEIIDTPGLYSLYNDANLSLTDKMVRDFILDKKYDLIINVITLDNINSNLLLTVNLLDLGIPTLVVVNADVDYKEANVNIKNFELMIGCKVFILNLNKIGKILKQNENNDSNKDFNKSLKTLGLLKKEIIFNSNFIPSPRIFYGMSVEKSLQAANSPKEKWEVIFKSKDTLDLTTKINKFIERIVDTSILKSNISSSNTITNKLDYIFLNKFFGFPLFLIIMYIFFFIVISVSSIFQDFFDAVGNIFFVELIQSIFDYYKINNFFSVLIVSLGGTIQTIATFIPILFIFFFCLGFLENSGYMSRGAYLTDSLMRLFGLPGKALISIIIGFGCTVPAVLSSRTISNNNERVLTIAAVPFISCSARLAVYVLFVAIFFPKYASIIIYSLYLLGVIVGIFTVWFFKNSLFNNKESFFIMELPKYRMPKIKYLAISSVIKVKDFITKRAVKIILPIVIVLNILHYSVSESESLKNSKILHSLHKLQVIFEPMGISYDNWEAPVSLIGGVVAKETVVTSLQSLYSLGEKKEITNNEEKVNVVNSIKIAIKDFGNAFLDLANKFTFNINYSIEDEETSITKTMYKKFSGGKTAFAYLVFILLYTPCFVALGAVKKEIGTKWMHFLNIWGIVLAYIVSTTVYQALTINQHVVFSSLWILGCVIFITIVFMFLRKYKSLLGLKYVNY